MFRLFWSDDTWLFVYELHYIVKMEGNMYFQNQKTKKYLICFQEGGKALYLKKKKFGFFFNVILWAKLNQVCQVPLRYGPKFQSKYALLVK